MTAPDARDATVPTGHDSALRPAHPQRIGAYEIERELGRGGMGVVYLAHDSKLRRHVAIKALIDGSAGDAQFLARFEREARVLAAINHPNVAAIHGIEEADGRPHLVLEYVPGETLAELIARGPLPLGRALDVCAQIAAALRAAHERGVVHRDLKPANVKLTPEGVVKVLDFGLAKRVHDADGATHVPSIEVSQPGLIVGTVAYMSPEQLRGQAVDARSDLWALGCVLYECLTARRAFGGASMPDTIATILQREPDWNALPANVPARIDGLLHRSLSKDPKERPQSAVEFAAAIPGGAALRAALEAGQTPTPEMVAGAGVEGRLAPRTALALCAATLGLLTLALWIAPRVFMEGREPLTQSPEVLTQRARTVLESFGGTRPPVDSAGRFWVEGEFADAHARSESPRERVGRAALIGFWYREAPVRLAATDYDPYQWLGDVTPFNPPLDVPGMATVFLDAEGRLVELARVAELDEYFEDDGMKPAPAGDFDWNVAFAHAGLELERFAPCEPSWLAPVPCDRRLAWCGVDPEDTSTALRVEAATLAGRPVLFELVWPWTAERARLTRSKTEGSLNGWAVMGGLGVLVIASCASLARRNLRRGEVDRRGARRLSLAVLLLHFVAWLFEADHIAAWAAQMHMALVELGYATFYAVVLWTAYVAIEPVIRRRWPWRIIAWTRLLAGRVRDPLVGRDVAIGALAGAALALLHMASVLLPRNGWLEPPAPFLLPSALVSEGLRHVLSDALLGAVLALIQGLLWFAVLFVAVRCLRREWLAFAVVLTLITLANTGISPGWEQQTPWWLIAPIAATFLGLAQRTGVLAVAVAVFVFLRVKAIPPWVDSAPWYQGNLVAMASIVVALAAFGAWVSSAPLERAAPRLAPA